MQCKAALVAVMFLGVAGPCWAGVTVDRPRCEYQVDPLGIDVAQPRLSWIVQSSERGEKQSAYQVLVASSPDILAHDQGDLWDSGRVASDQTIHVPYAGKPLNSRKQCFWKVRAWDKGGQASAWSKPVRWTMGLLSPADWNAKWIAYNNPAEPPPVTPHNGYHCQMAASANVTKWVAVDLGKEQTIDAVRLFPARPFDFKDTPGFLFPLRFKVEASRRGDFSDAKLVVDRTAADVPNPRLDAPVYRFGPVVARHVRLTVTRLACREGKNFGFALAELEVLAGGKNVAERAHVTAADSIESGGWSKAKLVDGRLLPERARRRRAAAGHHASQGVRPAGTRSPGGGLGHGARAVRVVDQRPAGGRSPARPRVHPLRQAHPIPDVRRYRAGAARAAMPWGPSWAAAGGPAR